MTTQRPRRDDGQIDRRYTVNKEHTGAPQPQYVARFNGQFLAADADEGVAWDIACEHKRKRDRDLSR